jgi:spermidine/putrescine transport system permease protein
MALASEATAPVGWGRIANHSIYRGIVDTAAGTQRRRLLLLGSLPVLWILAMNVGPILQMLRISFMSAYPLSAGQEASFTLEHWLVFFNERLYLIPYARTFVFAATFTAITLLLTYPVAYFLAKHVPRTHQLRYLLLLLIPFWVGEIVRTYAIMIILGNRGFVNLALSWVGLIERPIPFMYTSFSLGTGVIYLTVLYMLLPLYAALEKIPTHLLEAGADLGAGTWTRFRRITLPLSKDGIASGCTLVFLISTGYYATPVLLGGPNTTLFAETIGGFFHVAGDKWPVGAAFSTIMLVSALVSVGLFLKLMGRRGGGLFG